MTFAPHKLAFAIERCCASAARTAGKQFVESRPATAAQLQTLDKLVETIKPLRLGPELEWFWSTYDPCAFEWLLPMPSLCGLASSLEWWEESQELGPFPKILMTIAYQSQSELGMELVVDGESASAIFEWESDFEQKFSSLTDLFDCTADAYDDYEPTEAELDDPRQISDAIGWDVRQAGTKGSVDIPRGQPLQWPEHWQRAQGLDMSLVEPRGATHTVAEFAAAAASGAAVGRIVAAATHRGGGSRGPNFSEVHTKRLTDDSGELTASTAMPALRFGHPLPGRFYEFELRSFADSDEHPFFKRPGPRIEIMLVRPLA